MSSLSGGFCEYVRLFYQVAKGASSKVYIKKWKRRWLVLSLNFSPVECRLEHYDKESTWRNKKEGQVENLSEMADVRVLSDNDANHVLELVFSNRSLFVSFDSSTKLDTWRQKFQLLSDRYTVQLMKCPEQPSRIGLYVLDLQWTKIGLYDVHTLQLAWCWEIGHLRRFNFHANVPDIEVEAGTRSSTGEGHFFFTGINLRRLFNGLKERITVQSSALAFKHIPSTPPPPLPPPRATMPRIRSISERATTNITVFRFSESLPEIDSSPPQWQHNVSDQSTASTTQCHNRAGDGEYIKMKSDDSRLVSAGTAESVVSELHENRQSPTYVNSNPTSAMPQGTPSYVNLGNSSDESHHGFKPDCNVENSPCVIQPNPSYESCQESRRVYDCIPTKMIQS